MLNVYLTDGKAVFLFSSEARMTPFSATMHRPE